MQTFSLTDSTGQDAEVYVSEQVIPFVLFKICFSHKIQKLKKEYNNTPCYVDVMTVEIDNTEEEGKNVV